MPRRRGHALTGAITPLWVLNQAEVWGRAVELSRDGYFAANSSQPRNRLDALAEYVLWIHAMRQIWMVASEVRNVSFRPTETAMKIRVDAAVESLKLAVRVGDLVVLRDIYQHPNQFASGRLRHKNIRWPDPDIYRWSAAALAFRDAVRKVAGPWPGANVPAAGGALGGHD